MNSAFPNQVASGDTTQTSTVLWTRSTTPGSVSFEYSTNSDFSCILGTFCQTVTDPLLPVKHEVQGLSPGTQYFYRVTDATGNTASGQFKTAADPWTKTGLHFGVSGDWRGELSPYPAIRNAPERNLDFFVELGDTIYADFASPDVPLPQAQTLDQFRTKHNEVYSSHLGLNTLADLRASTSVLSILDDHEVTNDFAGGAPAASDPRFGITTGLINDTPLFETGVQAFQEYNPIRNEFYGDTGDPRTAGEQKLYRANTYGQDAAVFMLDARSFRDQELSPVANPTDPAQVGAFLARSFDIDPATGQPTPRRTLLGNQQLADLKRDLLKANLDGVTWKFVNLPEPIQNLGVTAASDRYEGYAAERTELLKFIDVNHINNVVFVTADLHGTLVNNLTYQEGPGQPQKATNAFEIITGPLGFDAPLGPTLVNYAASLGLVPPNQKAFYDALPVANDSDSIVNDKDDFLKQLINAQLAPLGYDPIGLNANLPVAQGLIDATLLQGDYVAGHTYGWTAFDIDQSSQKLTVTTYGIAPYTEAELNANPAGIAALQPQVVSQFTVNPKSVINLSTLKFTDKDDIVPKSGTAEIINTGTTDTLGGNDTLVGSGTVGIFNDGTINMGKGNDIVDALTGGFSGNGTINMGNGNDIVKGFGTGFFDGGKGKKDELLFGSGTYTISCNLNSSGFYKVDKGGTDMFVKNFERIGSANDPTGAISFSSVIGGSFTVV